MYWRDKFFKQYFDHTRVRTIKWSWRSRGIKTVSIRWMRFALLVWWYMAFLCLRFGENSFYVIIKLFWTRYVTPYELWLNHTRSTYRHRRKSERKMTIHNSCLSAPRSSVILLLLTSLLCACGSQKIIMSGRVIDHTGQSLSRVQVTTTPKTDIVTTDRNGYFYISAQVNVATQQKQPIQPDIYQVHLTKEGYKPWSFSTKVSGGETWLKRHILKQEAKVEVIEPKKTPFSDETSHTYRPPMRAS